MTFNVNNIKIYNMSRIDKNSFLFTRPISHRGLHNEHFPENSLSAFENSIKNNSPIELDVQLTKDNKLVVFHDDNLKRMTGVDKLINDADYNEIKNLKLCPMPYALYTDTIPLFSEVLKFVNGRVPLLIEIKNQIKAKNIEQATVDALKNYNGEFAIQSFNPKILLNVKKAAPDILLGQLSCFFRGEKGLAWYKRFILKRMLYNGKLKPDFVSYDVRELPYRRVNKNKICVLAWTIRAENEIEKAKKYAHNYIFESGGAPLQK